MTDKLRQIDPELHKGCEKLFSLANSFKELGAELKELKKERGDRSMQQNIEYQMSQVKEQYIDKVTHLINMHPEAARDIVEEASIYWEEQESWMNTDFRGYIFEKLFRRKAVDLYIPNENESVANTNYQYAIKFLERRLIWVQKLVKEGHERFEPYIHKLREALCKLKVWYATFYINHEDSSKLIRDVGGSFRKNELWKDLLVYIAQKTPHEIGGIDDVDEIDKAGLLRKENDPESGFEFIRFGHHIMREVQFDSFNEDFYVEFFFRMLEKELEIGGGIDHEYDRLGRYNRRRYSEQIRKASQRAYWPTVRGHRDHVGWKTGQVMGDPKEQLIPQPPEDFQAIVESVMEHHYKYKVDYDEPVDDPTFPVVENPVTLENDDEYTEALLEWAEEQFEDDQPKNEKDSK